MGGAEPPIELEFFRFALGLNLCATVVLGAMLLRSLYGPQGRDLKIRGATTMIEDDRLRDLDIETLRELAEELRQIRQENGRRVCPECLADLEPVESIRQERQEDGTAFFCHRCVVRWIRSDFI